MNKEEEITELLESGKIEVAGFSDAIRGQVIRPLTQSMLGPAKRPKSETPLVMVLHNGGPVRGGKTGTYATPFLDSLED